MNLRMSRCASCESWLIDAMHNVLRHRLRWRIKDRRFIHVVPESIHACMTKIAIKAAPPCACLLARKVWKDAGAGPYSTGINRAVGILDEVITGNAAVIRSVVTIWQVSNMQIGNRHHMKVVRFEPSNHSGEVRKRLRVDREGAIFFLEINIEIDCVCRNSIDSEPLRNLQNTILRHIAIARLLKPQRPQRRQRRSPRKPCVCLNYLLRRRPIENVVIDRTTRGAKGI